jgi:3-oxoacyl-[acyl-carrier-protein] synthase II/beta-ketoacyl ACP synthase
MRANGQPRQARDGRRGDFRYAVANSFGLGGQNVAVVFGAC